MKARLLLAVSLLAFIVLGARAGTPTQARIPPASTPHANLSPTLTPTGQPRSFLAVAVNNSRLSGPSTARVGGDVYVNPRWVTTEQVPVAYAVVLDVTGSMSYDFAGHGTRNGQDYECLRESPADPLPYSPDCDGGASSAWKVQSERRIYVARQAVRAFIDQLGPNDVMRLVAFSTNSAGAALLTTSSAWSSDKPFLHNVTLSAGMYNGDPYRTVGAAAGADALRKAGQVFSELPAKAPNGVAYKQVILYITDSVANVFLDGTINTAADICGDATAHPHPLEEPFCQLGQTSSGQLRPLSALIGVASTVKANAATIEINVIALAGVDSAGLPQVASSPGAFYQAQQPADLAAILNGIPSVVETCVARGGNQWVNHVDEAHAPQPPLGPGAFGYAYIYDPGSTVPRVVVPIGQENEQARLAFGGVDLLAGNYELAAYLRYRGDDGITRQYDYLVQPGASRISFVVPNESTGQTVVLPLFLDLQPDILLCSSSAG
jgi:hypothetical protein